MSTLKSLLVCLNYSLRCFIAFNPLTFYIYQYKLYSRSTWQEQGKISDSFVFYLLQTTVLGRGL